MHGTDVVKREATYWLKTSAFVSGEQNVSSEIYDMCLLEYLRESDAILKYRNVLAGEANWPKTAEIIKQQKK
jgi:hypothetical protein